MNHLKRVLTSLILLPLLILIIIFGKGWPFDLVILFCIYLCMREFFVLMEKGGIPCFKVSGTLAGIGLGLTFVFKRPALIILALTIAGILIFIDNLRLSMPFSKTIPSLSCTLLGIFYIPWMIGFLIPIRDLKGGAQLIFLLLSIIWSGDTLAFYTGSWFGRHKLCERISPKKTVEGMIGGLLGSALAASLLGHVWLPEASLLSCLFLGLALGSIGQMGDMSESIIKRWAGAKESGGILPGHGGLLDRIDGLIFNVPLFYFYVTMVLLRV